MGLDKRTGLYKVPAHHRTSDQSTSRPTFSSMDYESSDATDASDQEQVEEIPQKKDRSKSSGAEASRAASAPPPAFTSRPIATPTPRLTLKLGSKVKSEVDTQTKSEKGKQKQRKTDVSPSKSPQKRRRRDAFSTPAAPTKTDLANCAVYNGDMLEAIKESVKSAKEAFSGFESSPALATEAKAAAAAQSLPAPLSTPPQKRARSERAESESPMSVDFDRMAQETQKLDTKEKKKVSKGKEKAVEPNFEVEPDYEFSSSSPVLYDPTSPFFSSPPRKDFSKFARYKAKPWPREKTGIQAPRSRRGALTTPPKPKSQPVAPPSSPVSSNLAYRAKAGESSKSASGLPTSSTVLPPLSSLQLPEPSKRVPLAPLQIVPPAARAPGRTEVRDGDRAALSQSNRNTYVPSTQPYSYDPESLALDSDDNTSFESGFSGQKYHPRVHRGSNAKNVPVDPSTQPEADHRVFLVCYTNSQRCINFHNEMAYLTENDVWREHNYPEDPLPCLGQMVSGCNAKREAIIHVANQGRPLDPSARNQLPSFAAQTLLSKAATAALSAEDFLAHAVRARVPVALGAIEGTWTLYCPGYAVHHVDKYGYGQRRLHISSVQNLASNAYYTARITLPPRSLMFQLDNFVAPPHASFRSISVRTTDQRVKLELVFLGNGYLLLRVDMGLLLAGREMRRDDGRLVTMEFIGIHDEQAVEWDPVDFPYEDPEDEEPAPSSSLPVRPYSAPGSRGDEAEEAYSVRWEVPRTPANSLDWE